jgi:Kef-type K+ transport system membrane component KefB
VAVNQTESSLFWIVLCSVLAPLMAGLVRRRLVPEVVVLLVLGVLIGPHVLGWASTTGPIDLLRELGLGLLFLLAGYEIELRDLSSAGGRRACWTWVACLLTALIVVWLLGLSGAIHAEVAVAIALTSTALGTLLPILKDSGMLGSRVGDTVMHHGAFGEMGPVVAMALLLGSRGTVQSLAVLLLFGLAAIGVSVFATQLRREGSKLLAVIRAGAETTGQTVVRLSMLLLVTLGVLAVAVDLDVVLGAFAAGIILRQLLPAGHPSLELRLNGLAFGFLIPVFFVTSGMAIDPAAVAGSPGTLVVFLALILLIRSGLVFVSERLAAARAAPERRSSTRESFAVAMYAATGLPIIVAVTSSAVSAGQMSQANASILVAGGGITVLACPLVGTLLLGRHEGDVEAAAPAP